MITLFKVGNDFYRRRNLVLIFISSFILCSFFFDTAYSKNRKTYKSQEEIEKNFKDVIDNYYFINDFNLKPETRNISSDFFWKYRIKVKGSTFDLTGNFGSKEMFPVTEGEGIIYQHLNRSRIFFLEKNFNRASKTLLSAKARSEPSFKYMQRINYLLGLIFLNQAVNIEKKLEIQSRLPSQEQNTNTNVNGLVGTPKVSEAEQDGEDILTEANVRGFYANASSFLNLAFYSDSQDPFLKKIRADFLYNLSVINYRYRNYAFAYDLAEKGLDLIKKEGSTNHFIELMIIKADILTKSRSYLDAIKIYDNALRQDFINRKQASKILAKVADMYFDLNNYEIAEELYALSSKVDSSSFYPYQYVLRAESLFWMKEFDKSKLLFEQSLDYKNFPYIEEKDFLDTEYEQFAKIRIADIYLVKKNTKQASLEYFKIKHNYKNTYYAVLSDIRSTCLDFKSFDKNNIKHARNLFQNYLSELDDDRVRELDMACLTMSYVDSKEFVDRSKKFLEEYPESIFLKDMKLPLIKKQSSLIYTYLNKKDFTSAVHFFEANRQTLFKNIDSDLKIKLFEAYMDLGFYQKAIEFYTYYYNYLKDKLKSKDKDKDKSIDLILLRVATFNVENISSKDKNKNKEFIKLLEQRSWNLEDKKLVERYILRLISKVNKNDVKWVYNLVKVEENANIKNKTINTDKDSSKDNTKEDSKKKISKDTSIAQNISSDNRDFKCRYLYPITKSFIDFRSYKDIKEYKIADSIDDEINKELKELLTTKKECANELIGIEYELYKDDKEKLADKYLGRDLGSLNKHLSFLYWNVAQSISNTSYDKSQKLYKLIIDKAEKDCSEISLAKALYKGK